MIIDAHCHLADINTLPRKWFEDLAKVAVPILEKMGMENVTPDMVINDVFPNMLFDPTGERQLQAMDEAGIDKVVLFPVDYGLPLGEAPLSIEEINKQYADLQKKYPDRFITLATVDPRRPQALDLIKQALEEWGMKGIKLHQGSGFYPNDREVYRLLESLGDKSVPIVFHSGAIVAPLYSKYCDPMWLDDLCVDFPNLIFQAAHLGHGLRDSLCHLGACKTNLWVDFSDNQRRAVHEYKIFCESLRSALDNFGPDRVMFGTDGPYLRVVLSDKDYVQLVRDLPQNAPEGITFTEEEVTAMLGGNAARLYGLDQ